jgi:hypothetical protein
MFKQFILVAVFCISIQLSAQQGFYQNYNWEANPQYSVADASKDLVAVKDKIAVEFGFEDERFVEYFLEHRVLYLNSDDAIESYNKIYLPYTGNTDLLVNKARVIQKNGTIVELDESKILTADNEETGRKYKYFAFEGIEKGSFIEYYYIQKKNPQYTGKRLSFQGDYDKQVAEFDLYAPKNLVFAFKSYNQLPEVVKDTTASEKLHWSLKVENVKGLDEESQAPYNASRGFVIYKLDKNTYNNKTITSYDVVAQNLYAYYSPAEYEKDVQKQIDAFASKIGITADMDEESKTRTIDSYIKQNVYYSEAGNESLEDLNSVIANEAANETGILKLFVALFRKFGIKYEMVITSDRKNLKFDKEFEANNFLNEFLFYFPNSKKYLAPSEFSTRFGFPPAYWTDNYGLFISEVKVGSFASAVAKIKYIESIAAKESLDIMNIKVAFDEEDLTVSNIELKRLMSGYYAMYIQPFLNFIEEDKKGELMDEFAKFIDDNAEVTKRTMTNDDPELFGVKPFELDFEVSSEAFVNKAGRKYLFKIGDLIGPQQEMYQEKKRVLPLESEFQRSYVRTIEVAIPEGYQVANLDDINIKNIYSEDGKELFSFHSYYELKDGILNVTVDEHYRSNIVRPEIYEEYRKVINSAADFNKVTLVLEPK